MPVGLLPSSFAPIMLETASKSDDANGGKISYAQGFAEDLGYLESGKGVKPGEVGSVF